MDGPHPFASFFLGSDASSQAFLRSVGTQPQFSLSNSIH